MATDSLAVTTLPRRSLQHFRALLWAPRPWFGRFAMADGREDLDGTGSYRRRYDDREPPAPPAPHGITLSTSTLQFLIQLGILLVAICGFGFTIKNSVEVQGVKIEALKEENSEMKKEIKLLSYTLNQVQTDVGIIKAGRWRPAKGEPDNE